MNKKTIQIINKISEEHSNKVFGYLTKDDLKGEIWHICLVMIEEYEKSKGPLENWLRVGVRNRLINKFKDITKTVKSPCPKCPFFRKSGDPDSCKKFHEDRHLCDKYAYYQLSVNSRNSLLNSVEQRERQSTENLFDVVSLRELKGYIEGKIGQEFIADFKEVSTGGMIPKRRLEKLGIEIRRILDEQKEGYVE